MSENIKINFEDLDLIDVLNQLSDAVYLTDTDRTILFWNRQAEVITGWNSSEVIGRCCSEGILAHIDTKGRPLCSTDYCPLYRAIVTKHPSQEPIRIYALTKSRGRICVSVSVAPLFNHDGEVIGGIEVFRDETEAIRQQTVAVQIQESINNVNRCIDPRLEFSLVQEAKDELTGDFCNVYKVNEDKYGMVVCDVVGHGVPAALVTTMIHAFLYKNAAMWDVPSAMLRMLNERMCELNNSDVNCTIALARICLKTMKCTVSVAGAPPVVCFRDGSPVWIGAEGGVPCGYFDSAEYSEATYDIKKGDRIVLHSDGCVEITMPDGELLGYEKFYKKIGALTGVDENDALAAFKNQLIVDSDEIRLGDDFSILSTRIK
jgi:phosphoserine phosphatase RsbU/P